MSKQHRVDDYSSSTRSFADLKSQTEEVSFSYPGAFFDFTATCECFARMITQCECAHAWNARDTLRFRAQGMTSLRQRVQRCCDYQMTLLFVFLHLMMQIKDPRRKPKRKEQDKHAMQGSTGTHFNLASGSCCAWSQPQQVPAGDWSKTSHASEAFEAIPGTSRPERYEHDYPSPEG